MIHNESANFLYYLIPQLVNHAPDFARIGRSGLGATVRRFLRLEHIDLYCLAALLYASMMI